jgi:hypothetical protein
MSQTETSQPNSLREAGSCSEQTYESETDLVHAEPTSDYEYLEYCNSKSPAQSTFILEPPLSEDEGYLRVLESNLYETITPSLSFDALEFITSPLPPSSPLTSSTTYGSLLSLYQVSHRAETTLLDFDKIPLPSSVSGSCEVGASSLYGDSHHITPDLASASHLPRSSLSHKIPTLLTSYSKADLLPDLLTCDDPWNVIGDMLDLPPIPSADATYLNRIRLHHTLLHERVSSPASSSSLMQVVIEEPCNAQDKGARLRAVHSDGDLLNRPDPHQTSRRTSSPLLCRDSPKKAFSPERLSREALLSSDAGSLSSSSPASGKFSVLSDTPQPLLEPLALPASPGPLHGISGMGWGSSPALLKALSPSPSILPRASLSPDKSDSLKSVSRVSRVLFSEGNATTKLDPVIPVELIHDVSPTEITASKAQLPKLKGPDLFQDEDSLGEF